MDHERKQYLNWRVQVYPAVLDAFTIGNLICTLFETPSGDIGRWQWIADWYLEAIQPEIDRLVAQTESGRWWSAKVSSTAVRSSSCTYVFDAEDYAQWSEAVPFDE